jgi:hypothetical protein
MVDKSGYLTSYAAVQKLNQYKKLVNQMKDSYVDFHIKREDLINELKVAKIGKRDVLTKINAIESKMKAQTKVNAMFVTKAIDGSKVTSQAIKSTLTLDQINNVKESLPKGEDSAWMKSVQGLTDDASSQFNQIAKANQDISNLVKDRTVVTTASRDSYNQAVVDVENIKNSDIKQELLKELEPVLALITANEAKAQAIAQAQRQAQTVASKGGSTGGGTGGSGSTGSSGGSASRSTTSSGSTSGGSTAGKSTASSNQNVPDYLSGLTPGQSFYSETTGSGDIPGTSNTYETGTFQGN